MKKIIFTLIILFIINSCGVKSKSPESYNYRIVKIDSIENTYLIYAEKMNISIKNSAIIKIVSAKKEKHCKKNDLVIVDKNYNLNVISLYPQGLVSHHLKGITYNGTLIPFDKDYNVKKDLFTTEDLEGLCYKH